MKNQERLSQPIKLWFFSPFFYPETISTGKYNTILSQALAERGVEVNVVASHPFYPNWKPARSNLGLAHTTVYRGGAWVRYPKSVLLRRLVLECWFCFHAIYRTWRDRQDLMTVIGIFPPSLFFLFIGMMIPRSAKKIGIVHDLQGRLGLTGPGVGQRILYQMVKAVEKNVFRSCDKLIFLSHSMAERASEEYGLKLEKVAVNYPFVTVNGENKDESNLAGLFVEGARHVVYSGALGKKQNSYRLYEFFRESALEFPDVHFHLFSGGPTFEELKKAHDSNSCGRIHFHDLVPESDLEELYARSTLQLIPQSDVSSSACLPSKLPNILACGCPVLAICEAGSELAGIVEQIKSSVVAHSWDTEVLLPKLRNALEMANSQSRESRRENAKNLLLDLFSLNALVDCILGQRREEAERCPVTAAAAPEASS
jgi:colanic acid biosynthesis glycosyl transferase WcaI